MSTPPPPLAPSISDDAAARRRRKKSARRALLRWVKRALLGVVAGAVVAALVWAWLPKRVLVESSVARRQTLEVTVEEEGRTRVRDRYVVAAPAGGDLERIALQPGDVVAAGAQVARIRPPEPTILDPRTRADTEARLSAARSREQQAAAAVTRARAAHELAESEAVRGERLGDVLPQADREKLRLQEHMAAADLESAETGERVAAAEVRSLRALLGEPEGKKGADVIVTAPAGGRVLRVIRESEGPVAAGAALIELGDPRAIEVVVDVLSSDAANIQPGAPVEIDQWGGPPVRGRVTRVEPSAFTRISALGVEEQRVRVIVALDQAPGELGDGFRVEASITTWIGARVLAVPASALFRSGEGWAVYVIDHGRARLRRVDPGHRGRLDVEILRGLPEGTPVILYPGDQVRDGVKVKTAD